MYVIHFKHNYVLFNSIIIMDDNECDIFTLTKTSFSSSKKC